MHTVDEVSRAREGVQAEAGAPLSTALATQLALRQAKPHVPVDHVVTAVKIEIARGIGYHALEATGSTHRGLAKAMADRPLLGRTNTFWVCEAVHVLLHRPRYSLVCAHCAVAHSSKLSATSRRSHQPARRIAAGAARPYPGRPSAIRCALANEFVFWAAQVIGISSSATSSHFHNIQHF